jgi:hypothetical protein
MLNSPVDCKGVMPHPEIQRLADMNMYELIRFPMYYSDEMVMNELRKTQDINVMHYIAYMNGIIPIVTLGGHKSFIIDMKKAKYKRIT